MQSGSMFSEIRSTKFCSSWRSSLLLCVVSVALASCATSEPKVAVIQKAKPKPTEYFAESDVGAKASPRVVDVALASLPGGKIKRLPRGGGRDMVGKPYKIRGKWYHPREDADYKANGTASWYGDAFHGRLTANGEIYDMHNLTAAHPTMPLPSYARVTNLKNGKSVIVRVNDRGPYASDRLVDLSKRAAQLLDYTHSGTAKVKLEYIGRAPVHGQDDEYLLASYREGGGNSTDGMQPGVMVAMNESEPPQSSAIVSTAFAPDAGGQLLGAQVSEQVGTGDGVVLDETGIRGALPLSAPVLIDRPQVESQQECTTVEPCDGDGLLSGYAPSELRKPGSTAFASFDVDGKGATQERILLGSFTLTQGKRLQAQLGGLAKLTFDASSGNSVDVYARPVSGMSMDNLVRKLWRKGFSDAFVVR
jgi:rare lipoprotein A